MTSDPKVTAAAKRKIKRVVRKILQTTKRDKPTYLGKRTLTEQTGNLFKRSDVSFLQMRNKWVFKVELMEYYFFLDEGTKYIEPWFFTEKIQSNTDIADALEDHAAESLDKIFGQIISNLK